MFACMWVHVIYVCAMHGCIVYVCMCLCVGACYECAMYVCVCCVCIHVCLCVGAWWKGTTSLSTLLVKDLSGEVEHSSTASLATQHAPELYCVLRLYTGLKRDYHNQHWGNPRNPTSSHHTWLTDLCHLPDQYLGDFSWINFSCSRKLAMWGDSRIVCYTE